MEEGPEPQELMEHVEHGLETRGESEHVSKKHDGKGLTHLKSAVTAAILAVLAALGSLLSGHAANEAILLQTKASDQWSFYQAKSTKAHLYENNKTLIEAFIQVAQSGNKGATHATDTQGLLRHLTDNIDAKMKEYDQEKKEIQEKATELEKESAHEFAAHQLYSLAVACFQIGIVIASISILVENGALYAFSIVGGAAGIVLLVLGYFR
jgi:hypothetical protein